MFLLDIEFHIDGPLWDTEGHVPRLLQILLKYELFIAASFHPHGRYFLQSGLHFLQSC
jgi:hypothetical protein